MTMKTATFTEFRNNAKKFFDAVERGESIKIYRHGKPVAILKPAQPPESPWKTANPLRLKGVSLSRAILEDREDSD